MSSKNKGRLRQRGDVGHALSGTRHLESGCIATVVRRFDGQDR